MQPFEKEYFRKDGSRVPVLIGAVAFRRKTGTRVSAFVLDLTERKRAEAEARESERRYRAIARWSWRDVNRVAHDGAAHSVNRP